MLCANKTFTYGKPRGHLFVSWRTVKLCETRSTGTAKSVFEYSHVGYVHSNPDLAIGHVSLSLGPQDPRGPPANCGRHGVNCRYCISVVFNLFCSLKSTSVSVCFQGISRLPSAFVFLRWLKLAHISIQVCTFHDGCKQGIDQQIFNRKSITFYVKSISY